MAFTLHTELTGHIAKCKTVITNTKEGFTRETFVTVAIIYNRQTRHIQCTAYGQCSIALEVGGLIGKLIQIQGIIEEGAVRVRKIHIF